MPSLTQTEAQERRRLLVVERYDVSLDLRGMLEATELRARSEIHFSCSEIGARTFVDCMTTEVVAVELNGQRLAAAAEDGRIPLSGLSAQNVLVVESVQRDTEARHGVHRSVDRADGEVYVWMSFEPDDARRVFACFDQPDLKAPFRIRVTAPAHWTVLSNSPPAEITDVDGGRHWTFAETPPLSTYVPVVNAGPFEERRAQRDGYDLGLYARRSLRGCLDRDAVEMFDVTGAGLAYFGERFALPFPQHRYDQVFVPDMGGAMENYGCVTWSDVFIYRSEPSAAERELRTVILLHEMAHMWFGDIVTMRWWDDLWLNEAFADWAAVWAAAAVTEHTDAWATFLTGRKERGYVADRAPTTHPVRQPVRDVEAATAAFDMVTYAKGASVLKQLVAYVGEECFVAALRSYFARHAWGNATLADLMAEVAATSGRNLDTWTRDWLETAGTNTLRVTADVHGGSYAAVAVTQTAPEAYPVLRGHRLALGVYALDGATLRRRERLELDVSGERTAIEALDGAPAADLLLLNDDDLTFAQILLDERSQRALLEHAAALPTPLSRAVATSALWGLVVRAELPVTDFLRAAVDLLGVETSETVTEALLARAVAAVVHWAPAARYAALAATLADACLSLAGSDQPRIRTIGLRGLARTATTEPQLEALRSAAAGDTELTWRTLTRLAALDRFDPDAVAAAKREDPNPDVWVRELTVEAARPLAAAKERVWTAVLVDLAVPTGALGEVAAAFWQPAQDTLLAGYAQRYLESLPALSRGGMLASSAVATLMFPMVGVDDGFPDRAVIAAHRDGVLAKVSQSVGERADELGRMLTARARG